MIDYVYTKIHNLSKEELYDNPILSFDGVVNFKSGEIAPNTYRKRRGSIKRNDMVASYKSLTFSIVKDKHLHFDGSLHQFARGGKNNDDFYLHELHSVLNELHSNFGIDPAKTTLHNLEFGVNINLPFPVKLVLDSILQFKGKAGNRKDFFGGGDMLHFQFRQYELKLYDKRKQQGGSVNLLRVEIKIRKMDFLHSKSIPVYFLSDLLNAEILVKLGNLLFEFISHLLISDDIKESAILSPFEKELLRDGNNPRYWKSLKETNSENYKKRIARYNQLISQYGSNNIKNVLCQLTQDKWNLLTRNDHDDLFQYKECPF